MSRFFNLFEKAEFDSCTVNKAGRILCMKLNSYQRAFLRSKLQLNHRTLCVTEFIRRLKAFTLVEMLMALLIVSVILSASLPVISVRTKSQSMNSSKYSSVPIGMIAMWKADGALPDNSWLEANGQVIPNGIEYEQCRRIYGDRLPDLRGADNEFYTNLNNYLSKDIKDYLQSAIKPLPKDFIGIWGTTAAIPEGWSEASEYRGVFLRGYGTITHTQNNGSIVGNTATAHSSGVIGAVQGDSLRNIYGHIIWSDIYGGLGVWSLESMGGAIYTSGNSITTPARLAGNQYSTLTGDAFYLASSRITPTSNEIRPVNKAVRYIKYSSTAALPDLPKPPQYTQKFRYIIKVKN